MKIGLNFVDGVYRKEGTPKNRVEMSRQPVSGCVDFCRKAQTQRHEVIIYFDITRLKIHSSFVQKHLQFYNIPFDDINQVTPVSKEKYLSGLDVVIQPESEFMIRFTSFVSGRKSIAGPQKLLARQWVSGPKDR